MRSKKKPDPYTGESNKKFKKGKGNRQKYRLNDQLLPNEEFIRDISKNPIIDIDECYFSD